MKKLIILLLLPVVGIAADDHWVVVFDGWYYGHLEPDTVQTIAPLMTGMYYLERNWWMITDMGSEQDSDSIELRSFTIIGVPPDNRGLKVGQKVYCSRPKVRKIMLLDDGDIFLAEVDNIHIKPHKTEMDEGVGYRLIKQRGNQ